MDQSERVLDLVILEWRRVYDQLRAKMLEAAGLTVAEWAAWERSPAHAAEWRQLSLSLKRVEVDRMLLAGAVIVAAARTLVDAVPEALIAGMAAYAHHAAEPLTWLADIISGIL